MQDGVMTANLPASILLAPTAGPINPHAPKHYPTDGRHTLVGAVDDEAIDSSAFSAQYHQFLTAGYAADPTGSGALVGDAARYAAHTGNRAVVIAGGAASSVRGGRGPGGAPGASSSSSSSSSAAAAAAASGVGSGRETGRKRQRADDASDVSERQECGGQRGRWL
jgi:hypothetical protein